MIGLYEAEPPGSGAHLCHLYQRASTVSRTTVQFIREGLSRGEKCLVAVAPAQWESIEEQMRQHHPENEACLRSGQLLCQHERAPLLSQGRRFDPYFLLSWQQTFVARALQEGWRGGRIALDITWLLKELVLPEAIWKYETGSHTVFVAQNAPLTVLSHYQRSTLTPDLLAKLRAFHVQGDLWEESW